MQVNAIQKSILSQKILKRFDYNIKGKKIAVWGLAFKPNTDDIREAPSLCIIQTLLEHGATITVHDPEAMNNVRELLNDKVQYQEDMYEALQNADALAIITEWSVFRSPDFEFMKNKMNNALIFDGRNIFDPFKMKETGFEYFSIGRN